MGKSNVISVYSLEQAIEDGVLVELFKPLWKELSEGKPIVATSHVFNDLAKPEAEVSFIELWNKYAGWRKHIMPTLREEDRMFVTEINGKNVWVDETDAAMTMMYPEDY